MPKIRRRLSYANVVSTITLFLVLGGGAAYAASHLARNSVGVRQLRANSVTGAKVKNGSLTGADVNASTLGQVPSAQTASGAPPTGPASGALAGSYPNPRIPGGSITAAMLARGIPHDVNVVEQHLSGQVATKQEVSATCPKGQRVIGGGALAPTMGADEHVALTSDGPVESGPFTHEYNGWKAEAIEVNGGSNQRWGIEVFAICASF
jgi:hypothetical protein